GWVSDCFTHGEYTARFRKCATNLSVRKLLSLSIPFLRELAY
ncbi:hypothetical protein HMPREF9541_05224, partial [Escherichia coli MS 116-1]